MNSLSTSLDYNYNWCKSACPSPIYYDLLRFTPIYYGIFDFKVLKRQPVQFIAS